MNYEINNAVKVSFEKYCKQKSIDVVESNYSSGLIIYKIKNATKAQLDSIPFGAGTQFGSIPVPEGCLLYHTRNLGGISGCSTHGIRVEDMLYQVTPARSLNRGLALLRLRDKDNSDNVIWKIMNFDITNQDEQVNVIDLGQFREFDVLDEVGD